MLNISENFSLNSTLSSVYRLNFIGSHSKLFSISFICFLKFSYLIKALRKFNQEFQYYTLILFNFSFLFV